MMLVVMVIRFHGLSIQWSSICFVLFAHGLIFDQHERYRAIKYKLSIIILSHFAEACKPTNPSKQYII